MADQKVREMEPVETQIVEIMPPDIENLIYVVRNKQVMVDSDLAMLYQVETGALNRAVKRNIARFPEDFRFQLTKDEYENLKCQFGTSNGSGTENGYGGRRTLPYVFTEQGISMLASVLHSEVAINVSIGIMRAFVEMRRFIANNALLFERISNVELKQLEYQKKTDEKLEQIFEYISDHEESNQKIFFDGQIYDAFSLLIGLIQKAEMEIVLVDGYVDVGTLNILSKKKHMKNMHNGLKKERNLISFLQLRFSFHVRRMIFCVCWRDLQRCHGSGFLPLFYLENQDRLPSIV